MMRTLTHFTAALFTAALIAAPATAQAPAAKTAASNTAAKTAASNTAAKTAAPHPGAEVYQNLCQACHMANALGGVGAGRIPALAKNGALEAAAYPIAVVTGGKGAMPWFRGSLTDQQIADVINYVRTNYGNRYKDKVTPAMVAELGVAAPKGGRGE